jgi:hypothetical protein
MSERKLDTPIRFEDIPDSPMKTAAEMQNAPAPPGFCFLNYQAYSPGSWACVNHTTCVCENGYWKSMNTNC